MNAKEQWIDKAMYSLDGTGRAVLSPFISEKILQGIRDSGTGIDRVKFSLAWKIAAVILLLISLNIITLLYYQRSSANKQEAARSMATEYFSYIDNYNL